MSSSDDDVPLAQRKSVPDAKQEEKPAPVAPVAVKPAEDADSSDDDEPIAAKHAAKKEEKGTCKSL